MTSAWLGNLIIITAGTKPDLLSRKERTLKQLEDDEFWVNWQYTESGLKVTVCFDHLISEEVWKLNEGKQAITNSDPQKHKENKCFLRDVEHLASSAKNPFKQADRKLRKLQKNQKRSGTTKAKRLGSFLKKKRGATMISKFFHF